MAGSSEKVPIASAGPEDLQQFMPPAYSAVAVKPAATGRLLKAGIAVLIAGALLLLLGAVGAFYFWNNNEKHVYNVHYSMSINGKVEEGSMEIDTANNMERFSTGSGADEAVEVHDFEIGITGIRFSGGEKCYIKTQVKARLPDVEALNKDSMTFDLEDEVMPAKFEEDLIWVAADTPRLRLPQQQDQGPKGDLPIFWLHSYLLTTPATVRSDLRIPEKAGRGEFHSCRRRCRGHAEGPRIVTANGVCRLSVHMLLCEAVQSFPFSTREASRASRGNDEHDPMLDHHAGCPGGQELHPLPEDLRAAEATTRGQTTTEAVGGLQGHHALQL
ncbi:leukocyte cell-derived chemotaxin 1 [Lates japonicus]|uniref:Leukocyte cell-derived chemotaxin 1 n=1 Tax=Lates japonicus TaxID=270547 RepID=A0AAD3MCT4_LATJO|nr:leukocyte cell-derived chemotaxin 1 [Lates japonicus]